MTARSMPQIGDVIAGRYQLVEEIGHGGFGIIYMAHQNRAPREVALKLMKMTGTQIGPDEMRRRFRREAIMASQLVHPHAVRQLDFGEHQGMFYISMELVHGHTLGDRIKQQGTLSTELIVRVGRAVLDVLSLAHEKDIVHRDLKPENIMLCQVDGDRDFPKVLDFGAAKTVHGDHDLTSAGTALGSPAYMAPELLMGESPTPASDIYALGLTLGEAIVGRKVVPGDNPIDRARNQISPQPLDFPESLTSHELYPWLQGALQKKLSLRYSSAAAMTRTLNSLAPHLGDPAIAGGGAGLPEATMEMEVPKLGTDDFEVESTTLIEPSESSFEEFDDFEVESTTLMEPSEFPGATDELPTEQIRAPHHQRQPAAPYDVPEDKTETIPNPFFNPDLSADTDATTESLPTTGPDDAPTNPTQSTLERTGLGSHPPASQPADTVEEKVQDYSAFGSRGRDFDFGEDKERSAAMEIEPTADKDYKLVKTSDGRSDRIFLPALITGAVLLVLVTLMAYALAT